MFENDYGNFEYDVDFDRCFEMGHRPGQPGYGMSEGYGRPGGFGMNEGFGPNHSPEARKEERLFSRLEAEDRFADIDKAKHNEQYKNYLLENFEEY